MGVLEQATLRACLYCYLGLLLGLASSPNLVTVHIKSLLLATFHTPRPVERGVRLGFPLSPPFADRTISPHTKWCRGLAREILLAPDTWFFCTLGLCCL